MIELLFIVLIFVGGFFLGEAVTLYKLRRYIAKIVGEFKIKADEETVHVVPNHTLRNLVTEVHGEILYLYDKDTRDFICQGKTLDELAKLSKEYKKISGAIVFHKDKSYVFKDGNSYGI